MIKAFDQVVRGNLCGLLFKAMYIDKSVSKPPTDAMKLGIYLEYSLTGALPRNGVTPVPERTAKGELTAPYKKISQYKELWDNMIIRSQIDPVTIKTGVELSTTINGFTLKGITDVIAETYAKNTEIIDIKCSGFIRNKWEEYGWEELHRKPSLWQQLALYDFLYEVNYGKKPGLAFTIFNPSAYDARLIRVNIANRNIDEYKRYFEEKIEFMESSFELSNNTFWTSTIDFKECADCPLKETCKSCLIAPHSEEITVAMNYSRKY